MAQVEQDVYIEQVLANLNVEPNLAELLESWAQDAFDLDPAKKDYLARIWLTDSVGIDSELVKNLFYEQDPDAKEKVRQQLRIAIEDSVINPAYFWRVSASISTQGLSDEQISLLEEKDTRGAAAIAMFNIWRINPDGCSESINHLVDLYQEVTLRAAEPQPVG